MSELKNPKTVLLISGKRKSGKDFCVDLLTKRLTDFVVFRIAAPIKKQFAKDNNLDFEKLLDATHYKENYRQKMVEYSERIRKTDPNFFLRLTIEESNARSKSIWILSDARRLCDIEYFKNSDEFKNSKVLAIRICASIETRTKRGWTFTDGIDNKETECGLDSYQDWDFLIDNEGSDEDLIKKCEMNSLIVLYLFVIFNGCVECRTYLASNTRQLRDILRAVSPGDTIQLRDGFYSGVFVASRIGRADAPIRLVGSRKAILSNNKGTALYVTGRYWWISGFTITNSRQGIAVQNGKYNLLERLLIRNIGEQGISLRQDSDDNTIRNCIITRTGLQIPQYGFGISIGSDERQSYRGYVDRSDRNNIVSNRFQTSSPAEAIHAYEDTCCGIIRENTFDGRPITNTNNIQLFNRCWVSISGNNYRVENNSGRNTAVDGFRVRMSADTNRDYSGQSGGDTSRDTSTEINRDYVDDNDFESQGCGNQFRRNRCEINSNGFCIRVFNPNMCRVSVYSDNTVAGNGQLTNVAITNL